MVKRGARGPSSGRNSRRPVMRRWTTSSTPSNSITRNLPRRRSASTRRPVNASCSSTSFCCRDQRVDDTQAGQDEAGQTGLEPAAHGLDFGQLRHRTSLRARAPTSPAGTTAPGRASRPRRSRSLPAARRARGRPSAPGSMRRTSMTSSPSSRRRGGERHVAEHVASDTEVPGDRLRRRALAAGRHAIGERERRSPRRRMARRRGGSARGRAA